MLRKIWKIASRTLLAIFALLVVLIIGVSLFFDLDEELNAQKDKYIPEIEKLLGRKVQIGEIKTTLWPDLGADITAISVAGREGDELPLMKIAHIKFEADWWAALTSFGSDVQIKALVIDGLEANLVREADGSLSYEDVITRLTDGPPPEEAPAPLDPEVVEMIKQAKLDRIAIQNSRLHMVDKGTGGAPAETYINDLLFELTDVQLKDPFEVKLQAAVLTEKQNFDFRVKLGPVPIEGEVPMPVEWISLKAEQVDLAALTPYLGKDAPVKLEQAKLNADLRIDDPLAAGGTIKAHGTFALAPIALPGGKPFDFKLTPHLDFTPAEGALDIDGFDIALDDMTLHSTGSVTGLNGIHPQFKGLKITSSKLHFGRLKALLGPLMPALGPGGRLDGPFVVAMNADGNAEAQQIDLNVDLDKATIIVPGSFNKPKGVALHTLIEATLGSDSLFLKQLHLTAGGIDLALSGSIKNFVNPAIDIKGGTGRFNITGPARLSPAVAQAIPPDVQLAGQGGIDIAIKRAGGRLDAEVKLGVYNADLDVPGATLKGSGEIDLTAKGKPGAMAITAVGDLSNLAVVAGDALRKQAGVPMTLDLSAAIGKTAIDLSKGKVRFGPLDLSSSGRISTGGGPMNVKASLARFTLAEVAKMVPSLKESPFASATLGVDATFKGNPANPATVEASLKNLYFAQKGSTLKGQASVKNLDAPKIQFVLSSPNLDLDALLPEGGDEEAEEPESGPPNPVLKRIDGVGTINIAKGRAGGFPFKKMVGQLTLKNGVLNFKRLKFNAYDGEFDLTPTKANIADPVPSFETRVAMKRVSAQKLLSEQMNLPGTLVGRISTELTIKGRGAEWKDLKETLTGSLTLDLADGVLKTLDLEQAIFKPLNKRFGDIIPVPAGRDGTRLGKVNTRFNLNKGKMMLAELLTLDTKEGPLKLNGGIGLDKSLDLKGELMLSPKTLASVTGGRLKIDKALPVALSIGGTLTKPKISGIEGAALAAALAPQVAKALGAEKALEVAKKAEALAREKAAEAEKKAREIANKAKKKADEAKKKAEKKARDAANKAKKKAEDEAKKAFKGLF
ncbi:MAG: AsmA family protein [Bradymonadia bacterium]